MARILSFIFILFLPVSLFAQLSLSKNKKKNEILSNYHTRHAIAEVKRMKEGAVLVRLFNKTRQLELLEKSGKSDTIINIFKNKISDKNIEIIQAYKDNFTFCPVYFFYSNQSQLVSEGKLDDVVFVDHNGKEDTSIHVNETFYFTSEISENRKVSTSTYRRRYTKELDELDESHVLSMSRFEAAIIMDQLFVRLDPPFPYFARTFSHIPFLKRSKSKCVTRLNHKLKFYYEKYIDIEIDLITEELIEVPKKRIK